MPFSALTSELCSKIFSMLTPRLPFIGTETESFVEDAKKWKDLDSLMLVSKRINVSLSRALQSSESS
jgi:hypothetical protein